jgi:hypothetical protein
MKVRCKYNTGVAHQLTDGKTYNAINVNKNCGVMKDCYEVIDDNNQKIVFARDRFERVEEVMKIKEIGDLIQKKIGVYSFQTSAEWIYVFKNSMYHVNYSTRMSDEEIIAHLALLGIDIEFEKEVTITQAQYYLLKWLETLGEEVIVDINYKAYGLLAHYKNGKNLFTMELLNLWKAFSGLDEGRHKVSDLLKMKVEG